VAAKRVGAGKGYYMISAVSTKYNIHPQTLRLYEREGLLKPSRTEGNTRLYSDEDLQELETILALTRDLGVNLAGVEIILNMRRKMDRMQREVNEFMQYVKHELRRGLASDSGPDHEESPRQARVLGHMSDQLFIAVGTAITGRPPHRSERARLGHSAPTLGA